MTGLTLLSGCTEWTGCMYCHYTEGEIRLLLYRGEDSAGEIFCDCHYTRGDNYSAAGDFFMHCHYTEGEIAP